MAGPGGPTKLLRAGAKAGSRHWAGHTLYPHFQRRDGMTIRKYGGRYRALYDDVDELVCICLYRKGAAKVLRRL
jgi:hypothetical protein